MLTDILQDGGSPLQHSLRKYFIQQYSLNTASVQFCLHLAWSSISVFCTSFCNSNNRSRKDMKPCNEKEEKRLIKRVQNKLEKSLRMQCKCLWLWPGSIHSLGFAEATSLSHVITVESHHASAPHNNVREFNQLLQTHLQILPFGKVFSAPWPDHLSISLVGNNVPYQDVPEGECLGKQCKLQDQYLMAVRSEFNASGACMYKKCCGCEGGDSGELKSHRNWSKFKHYKSIERKNEKTTPTLSPSTDLEGGLCCKVQKGGLRECPINATPKRGWIEWTEF